MAGSHRASPAQKPRSRAAAAFKIVQDLAFTLVLPVLILSPRPLGLPFGAAHLLGSQVAAYVMAVLVQAAYSVADVLIQREFNPVTLFGGVSSLIGGGLAFWFVDGPWYAFKDALPRLLTGLVVLASCLTGRPLLSVFLHAIWVTGPVAARQRIEAALRTSTLRHALMTGTVFLGCSQVLAAVLAFVTDALLVTQPFGTAAFNEAVAKVTALRFAPLVGLFVLGLALGIGQVQRSLKRRYGPSASVYRPAQLARLMQQGEQQERWLRVHDRCGEASGGDQSSK